MGVTPQLPSKKPAVDCKKPVTVQKQCIVTMELLALEKKLPLLVTQKERRVGGGTFGIYFCNLQFFQKVTLHQNSQMADSQKKRVPLFKLFY